MRRPDGALEDDLLRVLWACDRPLLPAEILERSGLDLAYTSIATVLTRLVEKGIVSRKPDGKAYRYEAVFNESQLAARRIGSILKETSNRNLALAGFIKTLGRRDLKYLKSLLNDEA